MLECHVTANHQITNLLERLISNVQSLMNAQLNEILHHERFQQLESSWRGLMLLSVYASKHKSVKVKILSLCAKTLYKDLGNASDPEHSMLFQKIYTQEFDTPGGEPYGILLGDYQFTHKPTLNIKDSVSLLNHIGEICTAAFCPFISAIGPSHFGVDHFGEIPQHADINQLFKQTEYTRWKTLQENESSRFVNLVAPPFMIRQPYTTQTPHLKSRFFTETIQSTQEICWANPIYLMGCAIIECFIDTGWFGKLRGYNLRLPNIQAHYFGRQLAQKKQTAHSNHSLTQLLVTNHFERIISNRGYMALKDDPWQESVHLYNCPSLHTNTHHNDSISMVNLKISSMLHYVLCVSRFAHYIKVITRDKIGSFVDAKNCESALNRWLHQYTTSSKTSASNILARYPLSAANVQIKPKPGLAGEFNGIIHIKPHYQLDSMSSQLKLVTDIKLN